MNVKNKIEGKEGVIVTGQGTELDPITIKIDPNSIPSGGTGDKGDKGDKGDTGDVGPQGPKGDKGDTGNTGAKGDKGDTGIGIDTITGAKSGDNFVLTIKMTEGPDQTVTIENLYPTVE